MQVGCGLYEHEVKGRLYLYFWHYETRGGRRVQIKEYLGPAGSDVSRGEAVRMCDAYFRRMGRELREMRGSTLDAIRSG